MRNATATIPAVQDGDTGSARTAEAVLEARRRLLALQRPDGHWCGELEGDTILESEYVLARYFLSRTVDAKSRKAAETLRRHQLPGGGWPIYPGGPPEVSASAKAYFVLKLVGDDPDSEPMRRARETVRALGGLDACNSFTKIYLAVFGQFPWDKCPSVPPELVLVPRTIPVNIYAMSSWSRAILVPLSLISARKPHCPVPASAAIPELAVGDRRRGETTAWDAVFRAVDTGVKGAEALPFGMLRETAIARAERWILERLEGSDGIGAIFPPIVNTILGLHAIGYPLDHPVIAGQVRELEKLEIEDRDTLRVQPCFSPVWDTAYAITALLDSGLAPDAPEIVRAARWMLDRRGGPRGDWALTNPGAPSGGFYFEYANPFYPDCDTTAQVVTALHRVRMPEGEDALRCRTAIFEAHAWHVSMQNRDGGWAAFDRGCDFELLTRVPFADHNARIDPSTADLTARALESLAELGYGPDHPAVAAGVRYLRGQQEADGSWFGRWGCNYLYGTFLALQALARLGVPADDPAMKRGAAWIASCQNADGGWGETPASYDDPALKGKGASTASQTAWAILGLLAAGERDSDAVRRGVDHLLETREPGGAWREDAWTGTGFPRVFYLKYHLYAVYFPLMALGAYARSGDVAPGLRPRAASSGLVRIASARGERGERGESR